MFLMNTLTMMKDQRCFEKSSQSQFGIGITYKTSLKTILRQKGYKNKI